ncbi:MAG: SDR family oxidoreductase [Rhodoplanes sp.]|uniref:SDR family NAD(P)-dependent oxidoreductase n=1 Tax=Rhodoplanes sp. TaxID=1968906 RepID=UPI0017B46FDE|nr:SDR family oxidoreductase [Rhodoplanes sp.]NVO15796.1 SDR family oxidoreductase [Rhodoplanes sp.]
MRHAVVTGTSSGIGAAITRRLLDDGFQVTGLDRSAATIEAAGFTAIAVDLADPAARSAALDALDARAASAPVTAIVHAAGIMRGAPLGALDPATGELLWRIHVDAAIALADRLVPRMGAGGRVVLIGSRAARGVVQKSQYGAAKAALVGLAKSWAKEVAPRGITINVVAPAATDTGMLADPARAVIPPETPPFGRLIRPQEIAALVAFLLSDEAAAITGQEIAICGGASL